MLDTLDRVRSFQETAISPDGGRVAWVEDVSFADETTAIYVGRVGADGSSAPVRVTAATDGGTHRENSVAWSTDNHTLAFLSDANSPSQSQLYTIDLDGRGPARRVTSLTGQLAQPLWSPDGKQIAVLFVAGSTQGTGALVAHKPDAGVVGDKVEEQRIAILNLASGTVREISPVKTPTLVLHGDRDSEVPTPQGYEFWHALNALGVPTELVIYPDEGHAIRKPEHQHDIEERIVAWFDRYLTR